MGEDPLNDEAEAQKVKFVVTRKIVVQASPVTSSVTEVSKKHKSFMQHVQALHEHNASMCRFCCEMKTSRIPVSVELSIVREGNEAVHHVESCETCLAVSECEALCIHCMRRELDSRIVEMRDDMGDLINSCALAEAFNANAWLCEKTEDPHRHDLNDQQEFEYVDMNCITSKDIVTEDNTRPFLCRCERHLTEWADANMTQPVLMN